jgi:hypothetical protein
MIERSDRHQWFTRRLLSAMGLASVAGVAGMSLGAGACGGKVIFDSGATGSGGATAGVGGSGAGGTAPGCFVDTGPDTKVTEVCLDGETAPCPDASYPATAQQVAGILGICDGVNDACCGSDAVVEVACLDGSVESGCCYQVIVGPGSGCIGRPFTVEGAARTAPVRARGDWKLASKPRVRGLDRATRAALADAWAEDARFEHASIASFARLALELLAVGAPAELVRDAQRAMGDEIRHAELCFSLASAYAGEALGPDALPMEGALGRASLAEIAAAAVREGCIGETIAALAALEARDAAEEPAVRAALDAIAPDETEHAAMAWRLVAWAYRTGDAAVRDAIEAAFAEPFAPGGTPFPEKVDASALRAHGRLPPEDLASLAARALREVVRPSAAALFASA